MSEHKIEVERWPGERGRKKVLVDGVQWGAFEMITRGVHGAAYHLQDINNLEVLNGDKSYRVHSNYKKNRRDRILDPNLVVPDLHTRLIDTVRDAIAAGGLISPEEVERRHKVELAVYQKKLEAEAAKRKLKLKKRADAFIDANNLRYSEDLMRALVEEFERVIDMGL